MIRLIVSILFLLLGFTMQGQISISIDVEKDTVGIGELNNLTIKVVTPDPSWIKGYSLEPLNEIKPVVSFYENDSLDLVTNAEFDYLDFNSALPVNLSSNNFEKQANGKYVHTNSTRMIAWDIGQFAIPNVELTLDTIGGRKYNVLPLQPCGLVVLPPSNVEVPSEEQMIAPILPIIREGRTWQDWKWMIYALAFILLAAAIIYLLLKRRRKNSMVYEEEVIIRPSHEVAFEKLDNLESKNLWQQGKVKEYQTELTYTIREYLENRFGIQALESTTGEINKSLKNVDFDPKHTTNLNNILQIADMVKFAKAKPEESVHQEFMDKARSFVKDTLLIKKEDDNELAN